MPTIYRASGKTTGQCVRRVKMLRILEIEFENVTQKKFIVIKFIVITLTSKFEAFLIKIRGRAAVGTLPIRTNY